MMAAGNIGENSGTGMRRLRVSMRLFGGLMVVLAAGGCATDFEPTAAELKARWEAQNIFPQTYKSDLLAFLRTYLNDPSHLRGAAVSQPQLKPVGPGERYVACVRFNARNTDGKYAGSKDSAVIYVSGKLDRYVDGVTKDGAIRVKEFCKDAVYSPFPELERLTR
jgi:hypothetical protein